MKHFILFSIAILLTIVGNHTLQAQSKKKPLTIEEVRSWRGNSVTLSDNGQWYTTHYSLFDKPEKSDSTLEQKAKAYYKDNNQTGMLYIFSAKGDLKYKIPRGSKPVFSAASDWIAYQIAPKKDKGKDKIQEKEKEKEKEKNIIELKHLESNFTVKYESNASFRFLEDKNFFLTSDKNSLLIYDLVNRREHYIGNVGEYLVDKKSAYIAYTIAAKDKRGNGIYLYDPKKMTTRALQTGSFIFSNLAWNKGKNALAAYKYTKVKKKIDYATMSIIVIDGVDDQTSKFIEYPTKEIKGIPKNRQLATRFGKAPNQITWSNDGERLFIKLKKSDQKDKPSQGKSKTEKSKTEKSNEEKEASTVQIWHWKDKKLLSERIRDHERFKNKVFDALFFRNSKTVVPLTGKEVQKLIMSEGTDNWAIGSDNREYLSDWDIGKNDLYRINLKTGDKKLIEKKYRSRYRSRSGIQISPDGEKMIMWDGKHYWCYDFKKDSKHNISDGLKISFINKEYDRPGFVPNYGFVGWVKNQNAVIVNHKLDLWMLPLDKSKKPQNLTASVPTKDSIRFRFEADRFANKPAIEDRYIDLSSANILYAFNTHTKYAGYYNLQNGKLTKLIYKPISFTSVRNGLVKSKNSDVIIYKMGDYQNYPEAYLSSLNFKKTRKITNTNPQQKMYKWGKRILINYTNDDGVPLQGILSIPEGYKKGQKLPMIVYSYEKYSWRMYRYAIPYLSGSSVPEMLYVSDGYLFLQPDIHFNIGTPHSDMHECIDAAIKKVIELGYVDEKRIGYEGFSFGGHCGMYISTQKNRFAAIAAGAGVSNLVQGFNVDIVWDGSNEQDYYMISQGRLGTDPTSNTQMYISESAVFNAHTMNTPLLLFHGTADKVVQWEHSFGFYNILRYLKKPVVFLSYRGEAHGLRKESNRLDIQRRLKDYFDHYLKGKKAKKWMLEELPYTPSKKSEDKTKRTLPDWK